MKNENRGFTLIELMVVMTIIAVLAGFALVSLGGSRKAARDGRRKADLEQVRSALEMRRADCGDYPSGTLVSGNTITGDDATPGCQVCCSGTNYLTIPNDPSAGRQYVYTSTDGTTYNLCAALEVDPPGDVTDCGTCTVACNYKTTQP